MSVATLPTNDCTTGGQTSANSACCQLAMLEPDRQLLRIKYADVYGQDQPTGRPEYVSNHAAVEKPLGNGAFGVVWRVRDPRDGSRLALKKMTGVLDNPVLARRACRELGFLGSLRHENIVTAVGVLEEDNFPAEIYLLCNLMETDLHRIIVSPQPLSADHVKIFIYQLLRGLKYLHSANILHRDIKPGNLLVNSDCRLRICDFGLARSRGPASDESSLTLEVVTQYYRAPELLMGARQYTAAIDVWSAGCVLAELLGRRILFQSSTPLGQLDLILDLLGTPDVAEAGSLSGVCSAAQRYIRRLAPRKPRLPAALWASTPGVTVDALHLLELLLRFNPTQRCTATAALAHPYLDDARTRYHSCMCSCCCCCEVGTGARVWRARYQSPGNGPEPVYQFSDTELRLDFDPGAVGGAPRLLTALARRINRLNWRNSQQPLQLNPAAANLDRFL
uniref:Protein kinase domain-containing protein n=1 Tax=Macrostomum lignano TaxID=282301 RepID=A0A1I8GD11_9PLAT